MAYTWDDSEYHALPPAMQAARKLLQDWFEAMEQDGARGRIPDPFYPVSFPDDTLNAVVDHLEHEFERELRGWASSEAAGGYTATPGFSRLAPEQRLALCQDLHRLKQLYWLPPPPRETVSANPTGYPG